ncbi:MAG: UDP-2,3-diacylglucosamine diphosphatase [Steroidobacteraceae bacterium]
MPDPNYLFVSDLHLDAGAQDAHSLFMKFLANEARAARALYVLGDLFEVWVGDDDPEPSREEICRAMLELTRTGVPCYVIRGNRDFLFNTGFEQCTGATLLPDPVLATLYGTRVFVSHGDVLCTDDHAYQELRSVVRDPHWQHLFMALPLAARRALADRARAGSRDHTMRSSYKIMDVNESAVAAAFRVSQTRVMIHGHTHRPGIYRHSVDGAEAVRIVLGDWYEQGSYLVWGAEGYELRSL